MKQSQPTSRKRQLLHFACILVPTLLIGLNVANFMDVERTTQYNITLMQTASCATLRMELKDSVGSSSRWLVETVEEGWQTAPPRHLANCRVTWRHSSKLPWQPRDKRGQDNLIGSLSSFGEIDSIKTKHRPPVLFWPLAILLSLLFLKLSGRSLGSPKDQVS